MNIKHKTNQHALIHLCTITTYEIPSKRKSTHSKEYLKLLSPFRWCRNHYILELYSNRWNLNKMREQLLGNSVYFSKFLKLNIVEN